MRPRRSLFCARTSQRIASIPCRIIYENSTGNAPNRFSTRFPLLTGRMCPDSSAVELYRQDVERNVRPIERAVPKRRRLFPSKFGRFRTAGNGLSSRGVCNSRRSFFVCLIARRVAFIPCSLHKINWTKKWVGYLRNIAVFPVLESKRTRKANAP